MRHDEISTPESFSAFQQFRAKFGEDDCGPIDDARLAFEIGYNTGRKHERKAKAGLQVLGGYFSEMISDHCSAAGCNDMPREIFFVLDGDEKKALHEDFLEWDRERNPDGWEPRPLEVIPDIAWGAYFMAKALEAITGE